MGVACPLSLGKYLGKAKSGLANFLFTTLPMSIGNHMLLSAIIPRIAPKQLVIAY